MTLQPSRSNRPPMLDLPSAPRVDWPPRGAARQRSSKTGLLIAIGGGGLVLVVGLITVLAIVIGNVVSRRATEREAMRDLQSQSDQMRDSALRQLDSEDGLGFNAEQIARYMTGVQNTADKLSGPQGTALQALVNGVRDFQKDALAYQTLTQRLLTEGTIDPGGITSVSIIDSRVNLVRQADAANTKLIQSMRALPQQIRAEMAKSNLSQKIIDANMRGFEDGAKLPLLLQIRDEDHKMYASMLKMFDLFKREWGRWSVDRTAGGLRFTNDATADQYNRLVDEVQQAAARQATLQRQFLSRGSVPP